MSQSNLSPMPLSAGSIKDAGLSMGRGIFASRQIEVGEIIEVCPIIRINTPYQDLSAEIQNYVFNWEQLARESGVKALALGYGSLYNHANPSNATYSAGADGDTLVLTAARRIEANEQITINYNFSSGGTDSPDECWFETRNIEVLSLSE